MKKIWNGSLAPFTKHRDYCGDIKNHFDVEETSYEVSDVDLEFGEGVLTVTLTFEDGTDESYDYYIPLELDEDGGYEKLTTKEIKEIIERMILER